MQQMPLNFLRKMLRKQMVRPRFPRPESGHVRCIFQQYNLATSQEKARSNEKLSF